MITHAMVDVCLEGYLKRSMIGWTTWAIRRSPMKCLGFGCAICR